MEQVEEYPENQRKKVNLLHINPWVDVIEEPMDEYERVSRLYSLGIKGGIIICAEHGSLENIKRYIEFAKVPTTIIDVNGRTPLIAACDHGQWAVAKYLLSRPDALDFVDIKDNNGRSALDWAIEHQNEQVEILIRNLLDEK